MVALALGLAAPLAHAQMSQSDIPSLPPLPPSMQSSDVASVSVGSTSTGLGAATRGGAQSLSSGGPVRLDDGVTYETDPAGMPVGASEVRARAPVGASDARADRGDERAARPDLASDALGQPRMSRDRLGTEHPQTQTGFEKFVERNTGTRLRLFGYDLFEHSHKPANQSVANLPAPVDYEVGPGDEILLHAWGGVEGNLRLVVDRNGQVTVPKIGTVTVAGVRASELNNVFKKQIGRYYTNFNVDASLGHLRSIQIYVVGQAKAPGAYTVSSVSTLVSALFEAGGPAPTGSMRTIQLRRNGAIISTIDLYDFITHGNAAGDVHLLPGDVIVIPPAGPRVAVMGALDSPAIFELNGTTESLRSVLAYAGGTTALTNPDKVQIERVNENNPAAPHWVETRSLDAQGLSSTVKDGDIVTLFGANPKFANAVTLRGNVAAPLRYPYKPGMTLADLIPDPAALLTSDYFQRKNVLVEFQGKPRANANGIASDVRNLVDEPNWNYAVIERFDPTTFHEQLIPFNLGELVLKKNPQANLLLQPGDVVTIFGKRDLRNPLSSETRLVRVDGEVWAPGVYQLHPGESLQEALRQAGGVTPQAYLYGTVFTREATRKQQQQNLDKALDRAQEQSAGQLASALANLPTSSDNSYLQTQMANAQREEIARLRSLRPSGRVSLELSTRVAKVADLPDVALEDGDTIYVPPMPAYVTAIGAVDNENALIWKLNRTVGDALKVAGVQQDGADMRQAFVLRADGSVVSEGNTGWFNSFDSTDLMPGDTVVVPEKLDRRSPMTKFIAGLKDWSQVLANFGLGAAAVQVLK